MSAIPPSSVGSVLQSPAAQAEHARQIDADKNAQTERARATAAGPDAFIEIEATDADTKVHTESGGAGSQGRYDAPPEEEETTQQSPADGIIVDQDGRPHLDLSA
jgi:hypothetical protein